MKGKILIAILVFSSILMGVGLWYAQTRAYYEKITGITTITISGDDFSVTEYHGIDADTSPLKMRACFKVNWDYFPTDEFKNIATPLRAPSWFDCFNSEKITQDLQDGKATAILADKNIPFGFDTFIVQYENGNAFMWRQMNGCGEAQFSGKDLPDICPRFNDDRGSSVTLAPEDVEIKLMALNGQSEKISITNPLALKIGDDGFWACFNVEMSIAMITETYEIIGDVSPEKPGNDLDCFEAQTIANDVHSGLAIAVLGEKNILPGIDRMIAIYDDGIAFAWHQKVVE